MTLGDLIQDITVQGNVRLSVWKNSSEVSVDYVEGTGCLLNEAVIQSKLDEEVLYMFASPDGYLHIELASEDE